MQTLRFLFIVLIFFSQSGFAQTSRISYLKKDTFTKIISINEDSNHGDDFLTINVFQGVLDKVKWGDAISITSYRYLGVDNQNNLHIQMKESNYSLKSEDICQLVFKLDLSKPTEITLISQRSQKIPLLIRIQVEAGNNWIKSKYLGELPIYNN